MTLIGLRTSLLKMLILYIEVPVIVEIHHNVPAYPRGQTEM